MHDHATDPPVIDPSIDEGELLADTLDASVGTLQLCHRHGLDVTTYVAWLESPPVRTALDALRRAAEIRTQAIAASFAAEALKNVAAIATADLAEASATERCEARRAANTLFTHARINQRAPSASEGPTPDQPDASPSPSTPADSEPRHSSHTPSPNGHAPVPLSTAPSPTATLAARAGLPHAPPPLRRAA